MLIVTQLMKVPAPQRKDWPWIIISGVLQIALANVSVQVGMKSLGAGFAAVLNYSMPLWVAILAHFLLDEKFTRRKATGLTLSMFGLAILLNISGTGSWWAIFLTLAGAFAWAVSSIIIKLKLQECNMLQYTTWQMVAGTAVMAMYAAVFEQGGVQWSWPAVECLAYNGVLASAVAFMLWSYILANTEAGKASISIFAVPVIGVVSGVILLNEPLYWSTAVGMALILSGIFLVISQGKPVNEARECSD